MKIVYVLLLSLTPLLIYTQPIIELKSDVPNGGEIIIHVPLNKRKIRFELDIYFERNIIDSDSFIVDNHDYITVSNTTTTFLDRFPSHYEFKTCTGNFILKNTTQTAFHFYLPIKNTYIGVSHVISFAYKYKDPKHSLIHQLYEAGEIKKKQFAFQSIIHGENNLFSIGGVPPEYIEGKSKAVIQVDKSDNSWGFEITAIKYNSTITKSLNKQHAYLFTNDTDIYIDKHTFEWLKTEVFGNLMKNDTCRICSFGKRKTICCKEDSYMNIEKFSFVIQGYQFEFDRDEMFYCDENSKMCHLIIQVMSDKFCVVDNSWKIGYMFLTRFVTVFDYDESSISFYSEKEVMYTGEGVHAFYQGGGYGRKVLLWIEIVLLCGSGLVLGGVVIWRKGGFVGDK